jgi:hypothetical protein
MSQKPGFKIGRQKAAIKIDKLVLQNKKFKTSLHIKTNSFYCGKLKFTDQEIKS